MKFGVFDHMDDAGAAVSQHYQWRLQLVLEYDRSGFYAHHLAEHHGTPFGYAPSPGVFFAASITTYQEPPLRTSCVCNSALSSSPGPNSVLTPWK